MNKSKDSTINSSILNENSQYDGDIINTGKRKNDDDSNNSNSQSSSKSEKLEANKKIKIPIKISVQSNTNSNQLKSTKSNEKLQNSINSTNNLTKQTEQKPAAIIVPKLPTGNLAPSSKAPSTVVKNVSEKVAKVFGSDDEDETEEMPMEAKMKMRNIGRNTPTSTGPNSYGKTGNLGFVDQRKLFEKQLKEKAEELLKFEEENSKK